ncbi:transmembrane protein 135, partial [Tanacetum coccineum]
CAYILKQDSLPQTYKSFLNKHGGKDLAILQGVRDIACGMPFTNLEQIQNYYKSTGVDVTLDPRMKVPCSIVHGNQSCSWHAITFFLEEYKRAVPVYLPVYLIPALIVHRQGLGKRPFEILAKGSGHASSSGFSRDVMLPC